MKKRINVEYLEEVLATYYASKSDMAKQLGIRRSHLQEVLQNRGIGTKVLEGLKQESERKGFDYDLCIEPEAIWMAGEKVKSIEVTDGEGELMASITSRDIIQRNDTTVIVVPDED